MGSHVKNASPQGHPSSFILRHIVSSFNLNLSSRLFSFFYCNVHHCNKSHKLLIFISSILSSQPLKIIFSYVWTFWFFCLMISNPILSLAITLQNTFGFILSRENLMSLMFLFNSKHLSKKNLNKKIITLYFNNDGEYQAFATFLATNGISCLNTSPYT